jgi:hypothetical protein
MQNRARVSAFFAGKKKMNKCGIFSLNLELNYFEKESVEK